MTRDSHQVAVWCSPALAAAGGHHHKGLEKDLLQGWPLAAIQVLGFWNIPYVTK